MPRDGSGVYSKPAGTTASPNTTIESSKYNSTIDDLVADANTARPITAGGTGVTDLALPDGTLRIKNTVDGTKKLAFDTSGLTTATTRTLTVQDKDGTIALTSDAISYATTATAAGTTTLTVASARKQYFTGTTTQTVVLPVVSTLVLGQPFEIVNNSTGVVTVNSSGGNLIAVVTPRTQATFTCILLTGTTAASWDYKFGGTLTLVPSKPATSGTVVLFTDIPAWAKRITVILDNCSVSGTSNPILQLGDGGGLETSGYDGATTIINSGTNIVNFTTGFGFQSALAASVFGGTYVLNLIDPATNRWRANWNITTETSNYVGMGGKTLTATLDRLRMTTVGGSDTFDGSGATITISYE